MKFSEFSDYFIKPSILLATEELGYVEATPIQEKCIPLASSNEDILAQAPTGTGKTAAFGISVLNNIAINEKKIQAVILAPTRELTLQITEELKRLSKYMEGIRILPIFGGQNLDRQLAGIRKKPHIIVGTTGRVMDHLKRRTLKLDSVTTLVLDEADEMLDMGFREDIDFILKKMMRDVRVLLFSATMPEEIMQLSKEYQKDPIFIKTTVEGSDLPPIKQYLLNVQEDNKFNALKAIVDGEDYHNVLVFVNTKLRADMINQKLNDNFYISMALHGDLKQRERDKVMKNFREHKINILVATDVAARGIDVKDIEAIINYDVPLDEEFYVHRIGRTARANTQGVSYTFATSRDKRRVTECEQAAGVRMEVFEIKGITYTPRQRRGKGFGDDSMRFFINVGTKDGATEKKVMSFFKDNVNIPQDDILEVKLKDIYGFIQVKKEYEESMLSLNGAKCFRRKLSVEVAEEKETNKGKTKEDKTDKVSSKDRQERRARKDKKANNKKSSTKDIKGKDSKSKSKENKAIKKGDNVRKPLEEIEVKPVINKKAKIKKLKNDSNNSSYDELRNRSQNSRKIEGRSDNSKKHKNDVKSHNKDFNNKEHIVKHSDYEKSSHPAVKGNNRKSRDNKDRPRNVKTNNKGKDYKKSQGKVKAEEVKKAPRFYIG